MNAPPDATRKVSLADAAALVWVGLVFTFACGLRPHMMTGMINDEAVELLQVLDLPADHAYYFVPSYRGGLVDFIESLPSYLNRVLWSLFGPGPRPILGFHAVCLAVAAWLMYRVVRRVSGAGWGLVAAILLGGSSYALFYDQLLTRNALSPFWGALALWLGVIVLTAPGHAARTAALLGLSVTVTLAMASYTSFKLLAVPLYLALVVGLLRQRRRKAAAAAVLGALLVVALTAALWATRTPVETVLARGRYAMMPSVDPPRFARHLWRTAALPIVRDPGYKDFVTEETNDGYARAMLPPVLAPFFAIGLLGAFAWGCDSPVALWCATTFLLAVPVFALGGPNLKHCLALFPWIVALSVFGLCSAYRAIAPRWGMGAARLGVGTVIALFVAAEAVHLLRTIPANPRLAFMNGSAAATAEALAQNAAGHADAVLVGTLGVDVAQLRVRAEGSARGLPPIDIRWFPDRWDAGLERHLAAKPGALVVTQGEREPQFFLRAGRLRECYDKKLVKTGPYTSAVFAPTRPCQPKARRP